MVENRECSMSIVVNLVFDQDKLVHIEDAKSGEILETVGKWITLDDGVAALQLKVMGLHGGILSDENICPTCLRVIPPPPPDLSWRRSKP